MLFIRYVLSYKNSQSFYPDYLNVILHVDLLKIESHTWEIRYFRIFVTVIGRPGFMYRISLLLYCTKWS